ncbi:MAG: hypothetical protein ACOYIG_09075, partial [Acetivibrionales bacterium]
MGYEPFTREDWDTKTPKSFTERTYSPLMRKMVDLRSWGWINPPLLTEKKHSHRKDTINYCLRSKKTASRRGKHVVVSCAEDIESQAWQQYEHLTYSDKFMFYVMSPTSHISFAGLDIDRCKDGTTTQQDMDKAVELIREVMGCNVYTEPSTKGHGRHMYPIIDFTEYAHAYPCYPKKGYKGLSFSQACNRLLYKDSCSLGKLLKAYVNGKCSVNFDGVKGCYSDYRWEEFDGYELDYQWKDSTNPLYFLQRINGGMIFKQPKPTTAERFFEFLHQPVLSISDIQAIIERLLVLLDIIPGDIIPRDISSFSLHPVISSSNLLHINPHALQEPTVEDETDEAEREEGDPHDAARTDLPSANAVRLQPDAARSDFPAANTDLPYLAKGLFTPLSPPSPDTSLGVKIPSPRPRSCFDRYRLTIGELRRKLSRPPEFEEWNEFYEAKGWGGGATKEMRRPLFERVLAYVCETYDPAKVSNYHKPGRYIEEAKRLIPQEALARVNQGSRSKVRYEDIDMALGYVGFVLCDQGKDNVGTDNEMTVQQHGIIDWVKRKMEEGETKRAINKLQARMLFQLLREHGVIHLL